MAKGKQDKQMRKADAQVSEQPQDEVLSREQMMAQELSKRLDTVTTGLVGNLMNIYTLYEMFTEVTPVQFFRSVAAHFTNLADQHAEAAAKVAEEHAKAGHSHIPYDQPRPDVENLPEMSPADPEAPKEEDGTDVFAGVEVVVPED